MWWLIVLVAVIAFAILLTKLRVPGTGSSLLSRDYLLGPPPLETDQEKRDAVLKQFFTPDKVPSNLDAIIIGSGLGSLSTGVYLARAGKKVLVLEQHDQAGGTCHTFLENGFEFDVGVHYLGYMYDKTNVFATVIDNVCQGRVQWDFIPGTADKIVIDNHEKGGFREYKGFGGWLFENLVQQFPEEKEAIMKLRKMTYEEVIDQFIVIQGVKVLPLWLVKAVINSGILKYTMFKYQDVNVVQALDKCGIKNPDLRATITYMTSLMALDATNCPFMFFALVTQMYDGPSVYPRGGPTEIPLQLIPQIEAAGGRVLVNARVDEILFKEGRAQGVRVGKGLKQCEIYAPVIVSGAGMLATFQKGLVPRPIGEKSRYYKYTNSIGPSLAGIQVFIGLDGTAEELGLPASNIWYLKDPLIKEVSDAEHWPDTSVMLSGDIPWFYATCSSKKNSGWDARFPGKSVVLLIYFGPFYKFFEEFEKKGTIRHRGDDYENMKKEMAQSCWEKFCKLYPKVEDRVEHFEVGTPLSYNYYLNTSAGEAYGLDHHSGRASPTAIAEMRSKTDIPGLYLTGQDTMFGGIAIAALSGLLTASEILGSYAPYELLAMEKIAKWKEWTRKKAKAWIGE